MVFSGLFIELLKLIGSFGVVIGEEYVENYWKSLEIGG